MKQKPGGSKIVNSCCHVIYLQKTEKNMVTMNKTKQKHNQDLKKFNTEKCTLPQSCDTPTLLIYGLLLKR